MLKLYTICNIMPEVRSNTSRVEGPDGYALLIVLIVILAIPVFYLIFRYAFPKKRSSRVKSPFWRHTNVTVTLEKDRLYYPDRIKVTIKNRGNSDTDIDNPLLIFSNFWTRRKFRLKGNANYSYYPLLLEPGKTHDLIIDLNHFYRHDRRLKRYPVITLVISDVKGKKIANKSIMLRKTLFR